MYHSFSALTFIWSLPFGHVCPLITSCSFHKDTNHIGLEPILMTLLKISTSVVILFLNQSCSGVLGIRTSPDRLWKGTFNAKECSRHCFLHYKSFLCPHITNLQRKKWNFCYTTQLPSNTLDDTYCSRSTLPGINSLGGGGRGNQEGWPDHSSEAKELATCYAWNHLEFWQSLHPLRFRTLSHREQAGSSLPNLTRWHGVPNATGVVHISDLLKSPW